MCVGPCIIVITEE